LLVVEARPRSPRVPGAWSEGRRSGRGFAGRSGVCRRGVAAVVGWRNRRMSRAFERVEDESCFRGDEDAPRSRTAPGAGGPLDHGKPWARAREADTRPCLDIVQVDEQSPVRKRCRSTRWPAAGGVSSSKSSPTSVARDADEGGPRPPSSGPSGTSFTQPTHIAPATAQARRRRSPVWMSCVAPAKASQAITHLPDAGQVLRRWWAQQRDIQATNKRMRNSTPMTPTSLPLIGHDTRSR